MSHPMCITNVTFFSSMLSCPFPPLSIAKVQGPSTLPRAVVSEGLKPWWGQTSQNFWEHFLISYAWKICYNLVGTIPPSRYIFRLPCRVLELDVFFMTQLLKHSDVSENLFNLKFDLFYIYFHFYLSRSVLEIIYISFETRRQDLK